MNMKKLKIPLQIFFSALICCILCACQTDTGSPELIDCETAAELFKHQLVPCTENDFQGYSLGWVSNGQNGEVIYTNVNYHFSDGWIQIRDQSRGGGDIDFLLMDTDSVVYNGKTFYTKDASLEGYTAVTYFPNGETGLYYGACFPSDMELSEVFDLVLSLQIPD